MAITLGRDDLVRYAELARLLIKYGRSDLAEALTDAGGAQPLAPPERGNGSGKAKPPEAEELADDLERMGPIYVKLGQVLSSRSDLLPAPYVKALSRLQDKLDPFPYSEVEHIVREELGARISKAFGEFDPRPMAVASLGQVHRARLRDGREVAVKVQRPGIRQEMEGDLEALEHVADLADTHTDLGRRYRFSEVLDEFRRSLARELDYRQEAHNMQEIGGNLRDFPHIMIPQPVLDLCSSRVLTMDYVHGVKITDVSPVVLAEIDGEGLAEELFRAYLQQFLVDGVFHADPHPGNVFLTEGRCIALIDLGMVGYLSPRMQEQLLKMLLLVSEGKSDEAADLAIQMGELSDDFDEAGFRRQMEDLVAKHRHATVADLQIGRAMLEVSQVSGGSGMRLPTELTMLSKALLNLDEIGRTLNPHFNPNEAIRRNAADITRQRMMKAITPAGMMSGLMETREFAQELPRRVNRILDSLARNQLKLKVEAIDEATLIEGFQKVANRITMGLILAALIIGAAMLMRVETSFRIFGYPGFAMLCFLLAAGGGFGLILAILLTDRRK